MLLRYIPIILLFFLLFTLIYIFFFISTKNVTNIIQDNPPALVCKNRGTKQCVNSIGCRGENVCVDNEWTGCIIKQICTPKSREACVENFCANGYKICNECGTGYGNCTPDT